MDYSEMKIRNYDPKTDNYYKAGKFFYNKYKTAKTYGLQTLDVPKELNTLIKKWIKLNSNDYMLYSTNGNKLSSPQINRILNEAFGKAISTNMLRHIYLTEQYKNVPAIADMQELAREMGHSVGIAMEYVKK
jgi:integrase